MLAPILTHGTEIIHLVKNHALIKAEGDRYVCHVPELEETLIVFKRFVDEEPVFLVTKNCHGKARYSDSHRQVVLAKRYEEWLYIDRLSSSKPEEYTYYELKDVENVINRYLNEALA